MGCLCWVIYDDDDDDEKVELNSEEERGGRIDERGKEKRIEVSEWMNVEGWERIRMKIQNER